MHSKLFATIALATGLTAGTAPPAHADVADWLYPLLAIAADDRDHRDYREHHRRERRDRRDMRLSDLERELIREYFHDRDYDRGRDYHRGRDYRSLPPGLQKQVARGRGLPPGWQKKIARGEVLPGDIYRYRHPLPGDLLRRLPPQPYGTELYRIDDDIVRVIVGTQVLADILDL